MRIILSILILISGVSSILALLLLGGHIFSPPMGMILLFFVPLVLIGALATILSRIGIQFTSAHVGSFIHFVLKTSIVITVFLILALIYIDFIAA